MRVSYSPGYFTPLPEGHRFPMAKFPALHAILLRERLIREQDICEPGEAAFDDLRRVHTDAYLRDLAEGALSAQAQRRLGLPWSAALWRRSRLAVQGTINAARFALEDGIAANLAGGTHHAFADRGEGFCVLNDVAIAIRVLQAEGRIARALVVDLDVHQGNGTAEILQDDPTAFTFSMHGEKNYPFLKSRSWRDVALPDGAADEQYVDALMRILPELIELSRPELVLYLAGVDPVRGDRFGRLALTREGLQRRDRFVLQTVRSAGVPLVLLLAGGYAKTPEETADLHAIVHREAQERGA